MTVAILIVEDENDLRETLVEFFQEEGFDVYAAENGKIALDLLKMHSIDVVLTDVVMPEYDGIELIQAIQKNHSHIVIVALSGGGRMGPENYLELAKGLGAKEVFQKPVNFADLLSCVKKLLN